jgi:hypothetical protein
MYGTRGLSCGIKYRNTLQKCEVNLHIILEWEKPFKKIKREGVLLYL